PSMAGVARLSFTDLCGRARGAADYWALAQTFHTLLIDDIPRLNSDYRNEAARFVALIDALYEHKVKLLCAAQTSPAELYESRPDGHNKSSDGTFAFARTISRLEEMQSVDYLASAHIMLESLTLKHQD
ncbi:MAG: cell division protein ZapE, partial [Alphaproteobacteria bacterium]|nr:cell division protein ZapE [Alphaproteobacteria bacterium]